MLHKDEAFMQHALRLAKKAFHSGEIPVGCVIVMNDTIVGEGSNCSRSEEVPIMHAELLAIYNACRILKTSSLLQCTLYVTLEPCAMCAGAIINARVGKVVFGAHSANNGAAGSVIDLFYENFAHRPVVIGGIMQQECSELLSSFFKNLRDY